MAGEIGRLSTPKINEDSGLLTPQTVRDAMDSLIRSWDRFEEKRAKYYATLRPFLPKIKGNYILNFPMKTQDFKCN